MPFGLSIFRLAIHEAFAFDRQNAFNPSLPVCQLASVPTESKFVRVLLKMFAAHFVP